ncbi:unnamed protein product [Dracunculus medinensis]|uniref:PUM-HD domain-containing protein n=1 Tax=Dracunculus medinensis TaxID=318479 RepID=A0A0N4UC66_DRAME|nr:unnamed protein product [Dracunculus medinensis]
MDSLSESVEQLYPRDIVQYLEIIAFSRNNNEKSELNEIQEKCLEECSNNELLLLNFDNSSRLVEEIFKGYRPAAVQWMKAFMKIKKIKQLHLLYQGAACRTLETFLYALSPDYDSEIINHLIELVTDKWNDLIIDKSASRFIRSLMRYTVGLPRFTDVDTNKRKCDKKEHKRIKKVADRNKSLVMKQNNINNDEVSLIVQDAVECDAIAKTGFVLNFAMKGLEKPNDTLLQLKGKCSSRVWQKIFDVVDEDMRQSFFHSVLEGQLCDLACHKFANYVIQNFILSASSEELIVDIFDELLKDISVIFDNGKWSVINALAVAACKCNIYQEEFLENIKLYFGCNTEETAKFFVPRVITLQNDLIIDEVVQSIRFNTSLSNRLGSVLLQTLLNFDCNAIIIHSLVSLSKDCFMELCKNAPGAYFLGLFISCRSVPKKKKEKIGLKSKDSLIDMISDRCASHVFDAFWDSGLLKMDLKEKIMNYLRSNPRMVVKSKTGHAIMEKLNLRGYKENPKKWLKQEAARMKTIKL